MRKKAKAPHLKIDKSLDCANCDEVHQRIRFQDWLTERCGCLGVKDRNALWAKYKRGKLIKIGQRVIPFKL